MKVIDVIASRLLVILPEILNLRKVYNPNRNHNHNLVGLYGLAG